MRRGLLRRGRTITFAAILLGPTTPVQAQLGASLAVDSDYRFRGVSLGESAPTARASLNYDAANGCYGGASATRVELAQGDPYVQLLGYTGCAVPAGVGKHVEAGAAFLHFTGDSSYDFAEAYVGVLAERWGARLHFAPDYFGRHVSTLYAELDVHTLLDEHFRVFGHVGAIVRTGGDGGGASRSRADARFGVGWVMRALDLQVAWLAAGRGGPYPAVYDHRKSAWVASAAYSF
ncbi:MAG: TorF family putative porin [Caldimonas sp.]